MVTTGAVLLAFTTILLYRSAGYAVLCLRNTSRSSPPAIGDVSQMALINTPSSGPAVSV